MAKDLIKDHFETGEWLKDLFENAHDLIQIVHPDGTLIYVNRSWSSLLGYTIEEIVGRSLYSFIDEADLPRYLENRERVIKGLDGNRGVVFCLKDRTGQKVCVEGFVSAKMQDGVCLYTRGIFRDMTAWKHQENQLRRYNRELEEKEYNLEQLLINAPDAVVVINQDSSITFWNPKAAEIFGWSSDEVLNKSLTQTIVPGQYREAHENGMKRYLATGQPHVLNKTIEITALNKSGKEFYISLTIAQTMQAGRIAFIAFIRDITAQKTNLLALEEKTRELERSNADLEDFAYAASHDLKEPIRKILIFSDRLRERLHDKLGQEDLHLFGRMDTAARRMRTLVDDLLTYSHVNRDASLLETVDLNVKVQVVLEDLEMEVQEKAAIIKVGLLPVVKGHRRQLQQLFHNLIGNALKYSKPGRQPQIDISARIVRGGDTVLDLSLDDREKLFHLILIKDNGIGFPQEDAGRIFNVFTRLHASADYRGTGVGLSIVRKVVQNHGGYIWAEGNPGEGATFHVLLPAG